MANTVSLHPRKTSGSCPLILTIGKLLQGLGSTTSTMACQTTMPFGLVLLLTNFVSGCQKRPWKTNLTLSITSSSQSPTQGSITHTHNLMWSRSDHGLKMKGAMCNLVGTPEKPMACHENFLYSILCNFLEIVLKNSELSKILSGPNLSK